MTEYRKRTACSRGHPYQKGSFKLSPIRNSKGKVYLVRKCLVCRRDWENAKYRNDPVFRTRKRALTNARHQRKKAKP